MTTKRKPQDAVVSNVKRLRAEQRAHAKQANGRIRVLESDMRWLLRQWERWVAASARSKR